MQASGKANSACEGVGIPTVTSCALYLDMTASPPVPKYPGQTGIVLDYPGAGYHPADGDVAFCTAPCLGPTYGVILNNVNHCTTPPAPCPPPGAGGVPVPGSCANTLPWVGTKPVALTPSACPAAATIGVTIYWGTVVGGAPTNVICL